ncbi:DUF2628 domain-containing protein [Budviciaceae bacterium CWB-B4]|uniref:DUF2628 domain-containing protein n=1 Tax=Limnobaculum xujianqingii TaxID=2738837 RepID=A0A9D7AIV0_9GAMM|nr:DUF2628 domain-containing protein [Limnobaculum xujianqingii]MBK5073509.1 DUF2628 domain-containing protein [Limnobaculum xujianqingii]MBK5176760.1 DUF2628 domain-containing protein [Limnobaculum xujianqingii]
MEKCQKCGNMSVNDNGECVVCDESASVNPYAVSAAVTDSFPIDDISSTPEAEEYSKIFVGSKYYSFFPHGRDIPKSWNWAAFFIGVFWFIYRKMYLYAAIYLGLGFLLTGIQSMLGISEVITNVISIGMGVGAGVLANRLYKQHMDKKIAETLAVAQKSEIIPALKAKGGTNLIGALIAFGILFGIIVMSMSAMGI